MGKSLSTWQKWERQAERERERRRSTSAREAERDAVARRRAAERGRIRAERAQERAAVREERELQRRLDKQRQALERLEAEQQKQEQIAEWKEEVRTLHAYLDRLVRLHARSLDFSDLEREYAARTKRRAYIPRQFIPRPEPQPPHVSPFAPTPFVPVPFADSETKTRDRLNWLFLLPTPAAFIGFTQFLITPAVVGITAFTLVASLATMLVRRQYVLLPRYKIELEQRIAQHRAHEQHRWNAYNQWLVGEQARHAQALSQFRAAEADRRARFDAKERDNAVAFEANEEKRLSTLAACGRGEPLALAAMCCAALPIEFDVQYPESHQGATLDDHEVGFIAQPGAVRLFVQAPDMSIVPTKILQMSPDETKQKVSNIPEKERVSTYTAFASSLLLAYVRALYDACPFQRSVSVEIFTPGFDPATGAAIDILLVSAECRREVLDRVNLSQIDPVAFLDQANGRIRDMSKRAKPVPISAMRDDITWVAEGDWSTPVAFGVVAGQEEWEAANEFST